MICPNCDAEIIWMADHSDEEDNCWTEYTCSDDCGCDVTIRWKTEDEEDDEDIPCI